MNAYVLPSPMMVFKENVYWRSNMSFKKETEKFVLLQVKVLIQIIVMFRTEKNFVRIFFIHCQSPFKRDTKHFH